jgi:hypothetical protein
MRTIIYVILLLVVSLNAPAQLRICHSSIDLAAMQQNEPQRYQQWMQLEQFTTNFINSNNAGRLINPNGIIVIPVVVHILHRNESEGSGRNLSVAQIQSQIDVLNEDFRRLNNDRTNTPAVFAGVASDYIIEFRLACIDPNGNPTNGIVRKYTSKRNFSFSRSGSLPNETAIGIKFSNNGGDDAWPTNRYLNIWVGKFNDGTLGYATFPADFVNNPNVDGVVIDCESFGRTGTAKAPYNRGRTATHEVGHWLNLRHIWGDANCGNDFVGDTPPQNGPNYGCPGFPKLSTCTGNPPNGDMFMNYMDYSDDGCMNLFTNGQRLRGRAVFATGGPRAAFVDNYFAINQPQRTIRCKEAVTLNNPLCLPVTWSVISGPATIESSNNSQAILKANINASGTVALRAISGNYISDISFPISYEGPLPPLIYARNYDNSCGTFAEAYCTNPVGAESFVWNLNFGMVVQENQGYYGSYFYTSPLINSPQTGQYYYNYLSVQAKNSCGVSASSETWQFTVGPISSSCGSGGGGGPILLRVAPNPTPGTVNVETTDNSEFTQLKVVDRNGVVRKVLSLPKTKTAILNINDLPADIYRVQVLLTSGWRTATLIKQ